MTGLSKEINDCVRLGRYLLSAFEVDGPRVSALFHDVTSPHMDDGALPGAANFLVAVESKMRASLDLLTKSDFDVARAVGLESVLRQQFREDKQQLALQIVALRRLVLAQYLEPDMDNLGLQPVNVRDGMTILRRGELIGQRFEASNLAEMLGDSRFEGGIDLSSFVTEIRAKSAALLSLFGEIAEAHRGADQARIHRNEVREDYDRVFLRGARMFEDMCRFVGLDDLAARVRRRERRKSVVEESVVEESVVEESAPHLDGQTSEEVMAEAGLGAPGGRRRPGGRIDLEKPAGHGPEGVPERSLKSDEGVAFGYRAGRAYGGPPRHAGGVGF